MDAGDDKSYDDINVTPMVDLYLVLLLIFIIMTTAGVQSVKVDLPKAGKSAKDDGGCRGRERQQRCRRQEQFADHGKSLLVGEATRMLPLFPGSKI